MAKELRVLIVEDNDTTREVILECAKMILGNLGFDPDIVVSGDSRDALSLLDEGACFDLVLSDLRCNPANQQEFAGFLVVQKAKSNLPECACFVITADPLEEGLLLRGSSHGVARMFGKPFSLEKLEDGFREHLLVA